MRESQVIFMAESVTKPMVNRLPFPSMLKARVMYGLSQEINTLEQEIPARKNALEDRSLWASTRD